MPDASWLRETDCPIELLVVPAAVPRGDEGGSPAVVFDEREVRDIELEEPGQLVQENPRDPGRTVGVEQLVREAADFCELAIPARHFLFRIGHGSRAGHEQAEIAPLADDRDERDGREQDSDQANQRIAGERFLRDERLDAQDRKGETHGREDQRRREPDPVRLATLSPQCRGHRQAHGQIERRENEQRHRIEQHRLGLCAHRRPR